ncbi:MAG: glutamine--scyllo-inositol aminotransferase [Thermoprotei archaeon]|nr:MAG: glutamine--scyllo-inositol aminotransferase [Thermoprotei archaeon]RLE97631.1 MAG: glutamine--scyllo-inositol aminotransferase [Thermoprotei archaeon]
MKDKLAVEGGEPLITKPLPPPYPGALMIGEEEERAVLEVLRSKSLFRYYGPHPLYKVEEFEKSFARRIGCRYALAVTSGTAALFVAMKALELKPGDLVAVPAYTWISTPIAAVYCGARVVLVDVDESLNMDPGELEEVGQDVKLVVPVHMRGAPADMDGINRVAKSIGARVLEDVAQACGGSFRGRMLGSLGDMGAFSFQLNKNITAGEGGAVTTNDEELYRRAVAYHDVAAYYRKPEYIPPLPGLNFRMSELTAAVLVEQLRKLDVIVGRMRRVKRLVRSAVEECGLEPRKLCDEEGDTGVAVIFYAKTPEKAKLLAKALSAEGVPADVLYSPDRKYDGHVWINWKVLIGEHIVVRGDQGKRTLDLLCRAVQVNISPAMGEEDAELIARALRKVTARLT